MGDFDILHRLLRLARRRHILQLLVDQSAFAFSIACGGAILILLTGTEILAWYWPALLVVAAVGIAGYRARRRLLSPYSLARRIDRRLRLHDTISTAYHFLSPNSRGTPEVRELQRQGALKLAGTVDLNRALPFRVPRALYPAAGLALVAAGLFVLRYGVTGSLSLHPSLVKIAFDNFFTPDAKQLAKAKTPPAKKQDEDWYNTGVETELPQSNAVNQDRNPDDLLNTVDEPDVNNLNAPEDPKSTATGRPAERPVDQGADADEKPGKDPQSGEQMDQETGSTSRNNQSGAAKDQTPKNAGNQGSNAQEDSSLMDRMRDAMANLLNKLKLQRNRAGDNQQAQNQKGQSGQPSAEKGTRTENRPGAQGAQSPAQQQQQGQQGQQSASAQSQTGDRPADKSSLQDAKSGIGHEDGNKDAHEAEQLQAMGKISEIIGKRSQNMTGEVMVEVPSGKQHLKTPYSQRMAQHSEAGGEIHRDEVPLIYQQYVQQYFEEIRKSAPSSGATKSKASEPVVKSTK